MGTLLGLTHQADYAIRAMLLLAGAGGRTVSSRRIAAAMKIPPRFMGQVMGDLVRAGLVETSTGRRGGYRLARPAAEINVLSVILASGVQLRRGRCVLRNVQCATDGTCGFHEIFATAEATLVNGLRGTTLESAKLQASVRDAVAEATWGGS